MSGKLPDRLAPKGPQTDPPLKTDTVPKLTVGNYGWSAWSSHQHITHPKNRKEIRYVDPDAADGKITQDTKNVTVRTKDWMGTNDLTKSLTKAAEHFWYRFGERPHWAPEGTKNPFDVKDVEK